MKIAALIVGLAVFIVLLAIWPLDKDDDAPW